MFVSHTQHILQNPALSELEALATGLSSLYHSNLYVGGSNASSVIGSSWDLKMAVKNNKRNISNFYLIID